MDDKKELDITPFSFQWTTGLNTDVPLVNLTTKNRNLIAYACSHMVILCDHVSKETWTLQGHQNEIRSLSASRDGKWLLSADFHQDSICIVWDTETRIPICSLFNPHGKCSLSAVKLSPDARFIVTVGNEKVQIVKFWLWTFAKEIPDATAKLSKTSADRAKNIIFNNDNPEEFLLTLDHCVIFVSWIGEENLEIHQPKMSEKNDETIGELNDSCFLSGSDRAMTITSHGFVLVWSDKEYANEFEEGKMKKQFFKSVPLHKGKLTRIKCFKGIIIIGNNWGHLYFYDYQLKILYWSKNCGFDSIVSISFDREESSLIGKPEDASASLSSMSQSDITESSADSMDDESWLKLTESEIDGDVYDDSESENCVNGISKIENVGNDGSRKKECPERCSKTKANSVVSSNAIHFFRSSREPTDFTVRAAESFSFPKFFVSSISGKIGHLDISNFKCRILNKAYDGYVTAIATRPGSDYIATGGTLGVLSLYRYTTRRRMVSKDTRNLPHFEESMSLNDGKLDTTYVTCPQIHRSLIGVSALKFSPAKDGNLVCGLESGVLWVLHPDTLDPIDPNPYKHSTCSISEIVFSHDGKYLAYSDDAFTVGVLRKNEKKTETNVWNFLGKYHSHVSSIRQILFLKPAVGTFSPRFVSLGEDEYLVEYDLEKRVWFVSYSGPYPVPGLKILRSDKIKDLSMPLCMAVYPEFQLETFLVTANSEFKFRLINDNTKATRATILGPTLGDPVQKICIIGNKMHENRAERGYMIFATSKEIGLSSLPLDGNPYRMVAMTGHPKKIKSITISDCAEYLFTFAENDFGITMWRINKKSVGRMERVGGKGLLPFYTLIEGGKDGWLVNEMKDLFYYAQILQHGENMLGTRIVSDKVSLMQLPNLMRALGFYPTNSELETMMEEVSYKNYAETGQLAEEINFQDLVKLYVNHRPAFGPTRDQVKNVFRAFAKGDNSENPNLTSDQFLKILFGRGNFSSTKLHGEPLSIEEAHAYLGRLIPQQDQDSTSWTGSRDEKVSKADINFEFLPQNISYKMFMDEILGIENPDTPI